DRRMDETAPSPYYIEVRSRKFFGSLQSPPQSPAFEWVVAFSAFGRRDDCLDHFRQLGPAFSSNSGRVRRVASMSLCLVILRIAIMLYSASFVKGSFSMPWPSQRFPVGAYGLSSHQGSNPTPFRAAFSERASRPFDAALRLAGVSGGHLIGRFASP